MREKIELVLSQVRLALQADGGDVELVDMDDGVVKVRLKGACNGCPMATLTLHNMIGKALKDKVPGVKDVVAV